MKRFAAFSLGLFAVLAVSGSAQATVFQFYNDDGNNVNCAVGFDNCVLGDAIAPSLDFSEGAVSFTVTQSGALEVEQDTVPLYGGLGANGTSDNDNVDNGEALTFTSSSGSLFLMTVSMFDENHGLNNELFSAPNGDASDDDLAIFVDGDLLGTFDAQSMIDLASMFDASDLTGNVFTFEAIGDEGFYIAALDLVGSGVPEPGTALLIGLGVAGLASRRRTQLS